MNIIGQRAVRAAVTGAAILSFSAVTPAHAEGSWSSYISNWIAEDESRRWDDRNTDSVSTSVGLNGCSSSPTSFRSVTLAVYKDVFGPDDNKGNKDNTCGTNYWGDLSSGTYYFSAELINKNATGYRFSASAVYVRY